MKLVIDIPEEVYTFIRNVWKDVESDKRSPFSELCKAVENGKPLPQSATNGDMIKALFPDAKVNVAKYSYVIEVKLPYHTEYDTGLLCDRGWWNTPYKEEDDM